MKAYWILFHQRQMAVEDIGDGRARLYYQEEPPVDREQLGHLFHYHLSDGTPVYVGEAEIPSPAPGMLMTPLRESFYLLSQSDFLLAGKSEELLHWDLHTRYCGRCGTPTVHGTEISKKCPSCDEELWPQLNVAVIGLIERGDEVLLVHAKTFHSDFYGLVAGFVETGETLEDALRREVMEETSLRIRNIRYFDSQPWPYPCNLMVGFYAEYESGELHLQYIELERGGWFHYDRLPNLPQKMSIARRLIDHWLEEKKKATQ